MKIGFCQLYILGLEPPNPSSTDNIIFVTYYYSAVNPVFNIYHEQSTSNDTIHRYVIFCHDDTYHFSGHDLDTILIGILPAGDYVISFSYDATLTSENCIPAGVLNDSIIEFVVTESTGMQEFGQEEMKISPNPVDQYFAIVNLKSTDSNAGIKIWNMLGELVKTFNAATDQLEVSELPSGIYYIEIKIHSCSSIIKMQKL